MLFKGEIRFSLLLSFLNWATSQLVPCSKELPPCNQISSHRRKRREKHIFFSPKIETQAKPPSPPSKKKKERKKKQSNNYWKANIDKHYSRNHCYGRIVGKSRTLTEMKTTTMAFWVQSCMIETSIILLTVRYAISIFRVKQNERDLQHQFFM